MNRRRTYLACSATAALLLTSAPHASGAGPARVEDSAKDAAYDCPMPAPASAAARATELGAAHWDKNKLGCAADIWAALAAAQPDDPMLAVQALLATTAYIDHVNALSNYDTYGIREPEWTARIRHAAEQGKVLEGRLAALPADDPNVLAARALYRLTWPAKIADTRTQLAESRAAMQLLDRAVGLDPKALDGNALWVLGRLYYDVPEFAGGDPVRAMQLLEDAYRNTPANPSLLRYTAYVYLQERDVARAKARLAAMLALAPQGGDPQLLADELKGAQDLAIRAGDGALAQQLTAKRNALLKAHPQLLRRQATAANMHGGVDPITGKDY